MGDLDQSLKNYYIKESRYLNILIPQHIMQPKRRITNIMTTCSLTDLHPYFNQIVTYRRWLHQHPELSYQEIETSQYIFDNLSKLKHAEITRPTKTSLLVRFITDRPGLKIGFRADIDALAIHEEHNYSYASSNPGVMHACGHDGHAAMLMGACHYFDQHLDQFDGEIWAIFQHAEEVLPSGAVEMMATGLFDELDFIYAHHLWATQPLGTIDIKSGAASSNTDRYLATLYGRGGHAAEPEHSIDPIVMGATAIHKIQTIVSRQLSPHDAGVISNTLFQAGSPESINVIPDSVKIGGSVRSSSQKVRELFQKGIETMIATTVEAYGGTYEFHYDVGNNAVMNDPQATNRVRTILESALPELELITQPPMLAGEDFYAFSDKIPATYLFIGASKPNADGQIYPHHHPKFDISEEALLHGFAVIVNVALNYR